MSGCAVFARVSLPFTRVYRLQVRVNQIPRQIPPQPWYLNPIPSVLVGGVLPFGAIFIELFFIMSNIWLAQVRKPLAVTCLRRTVVLVFRYLATPLDPSRYDLRQREGWQWRILIGGRWSRVCVCV